MVGFDNIIRLFACISLIIGAVECFAGFKIMKAMIAIWGFLIGAMIGVAVGYALDNTILGFVMIILLGVMLAFLSFKLYLAGIFILTAFLTAVTIYIICENIIVGLIFAIAVGTVAVFFVKPVVIVTTSISGAGIILSSAYIMMNMELSASPTIAAILWIPIAISGIAVQYITTKKSKHEKKYRRLVNQTTTFSERKYPGMQRAYRNFCIKCGCELFESTDRCPRCGYSYDD